MLSDMNLIQEVIWSSLSLNHQKRIAVCVVVFYNIEHHSGALKALCLFLSELCKLIGEENILSHQCEW